MRSNLVFFLMLCALGKGNKETRCLVTDEHNLQCTFSENINQTGKDFVAYFYPDHGKEVNAFPERLVDCGWIRRKLECVTQEGVECQKPVNDTAVIRVPTRFTTRTGSYKCVIEGHKPDTILSCGFSKSQSINEDAETTRETNAVSDGNQVTLNRSFPFDQKQSSSISVIEIALLLTVVPLLVVLLVVVAVKSRLLSILRKISNRRRPSEAENMKVEELTSLDCNLEA